MTTTTIHEIEEKLEELREAARTKHGLNACASIVDWLLNRMEGEWTDAEIDSSRNAEAMKILGGGDEHGGAPVPHPSATATVPTPEEQEIIDHYQELHNRAIIQKVARGMKSWADTLIDHLKGIKHIQREDADRRDANYYEAHINDALVGMETDRVKQADDSEDLEADLDKLSEPQQGFRKALNDFNKFRKVHNLNRRVKYIDDQGNFWALLLIYFIGEVGFNGFLYAKVTDGLIEGWLIALLVTSAVMICGWGAGWAAIHLRGREEGPSEESGKETMIWRDHNFWWQLGWGVGTAVLIGLVLLAITGAYLYRDISEYLLLFGTFDNLDNSALRSPIILAEMAKRIWQWPPEIWPQSGITALGVIVINGLGGWLSYAKRHFSWDDCLPGYMEYAKLLNEKRVYYISEIKKLEEDYGLGEGREQEFVKKLEKATPTQSHIAEMQRVVKTITGKAQYLQDLAKREAGTYAERCKIILQVYRQANREARPKDDKDGPAYFNEYPEFESHGMADLRKDYEELGKRIEEIEDIAAPNIERILSGHRNKAVEILTKKLKEGRRRRIDQHKSESKKQWQEELTEEQKKNVESEQKKTERDQKRRERRISRRPRG